MNDGTIGMVVMSSSEYDKLVDERGALQDEIHDVNTELSRCRAERDASQRTLNARRHDLYERAYLAAMTGLLASGSYDPYGASIDAHNCAVKAIAAIERAAGGEG